MVAVAVVRKHMFANEREPMLFSILVFATDAEAAAWIEANPVDDYTRIGNAYQYEQYEPRLVGVAS